MKRKIPKILLIISFLPYIATIIYGLYRAFVGFPVFSGDRVYGLGGFIGGLLEFLCILAIPTLICLIYQICYFMRNKIKRLKNVKLKIYIIVCLIIGGILTTILLIFFYSFEIKQFIEKQNAIQMIKNAEEKIAFNKHYTNIGGIFNIKGYEHNHILIDYDKCEVGMLLRPDYDEFWKVKLKKTTKDNTEYKHIINNYYIQTDIPLKAPGKRLITFYEDRSLIHTTIAILLITEDDTVYIADNIKDNKTNFTRYTGLNTSDYFIGYDIKYNDDKSQIDNKEIDFYLIKSNNNLNSENFKIYYTFDNINIYFTSNLEEMYIVKDKTSSLEYYIKNNNLSLENVITQITNKLNMNDALYDGGIEIYKSEDKDITLIKCNKEKDNQNIFIGDYSLKYSDNMCR